MFNAIVAKDLVILWRLAHKISVTITSSKGILSHVQFFLKKVRNCLSCLYWCFKLLHLLFLHLLQIHLLWKWYNKWLCLLFLPLVYQVIFTFLLKLGTLILVCLIWKILLCLYPMLCRIKCLWRSFWRDLKWNDSFHYVYLLPHVVICFLLFA